MVKEKYPEELTERESEDYDFKRFDDSDSYKEDYFKAVAYQKKKGGEVYTMVDGYGTSVDFFKGVHHFDRLGVVVLQ